MCRPMYKEFILTKNTKISVTLNYITFNFITLLLLKSELVATTVHRRWSIRGRVFPLLLQFCV